MSGRSLAEGLAASVAFEVACGAAVNAGRGGVAVGPQAETTTPRSSRVREIHEVRLIVPSSAPPSTIGRPAILAWESEPADGMASGRSRGLAVSRAESRSLLR